MPKIRLVSYASNEFVKFNAHRRFQNQAKQFEQFDEIFVYEKKDMSEEYKNRYEHLINEKTGDRLWSWKSFIIKQELQKLDENDLLIYLDIGCELNYNLNSNYKMNEYIDYTAKNGYLFFTTNLPNFQWTKSILMRKINEEDYFRNQVSGGTIFLKNNQKIRDLIKNWEELCFLNGSDLLRSEVINKDKYTAHRHDQSILTYLILKNKLKVFKSNDTYFEDWRDGKNYPIIAIRNKYRVSMLRTIFEVNIFFKIINRLYKSKLYSIGVKYTNKIFKKSRLFNKIKYKTIS
jgi:hypothetical protein